MKTIKQKEAQNRNKKLKEEALKNGVIDKAARYLSAMYLLQSENTSLLADLENILDEGGYMIGSMKYDIEKLNKAFDKFFDKFCKFIPREMVNKFANDLNNFDEQFKKYCRL